MFRQIYLTKYSFNPENVINGCAITYLDNVQIVLPTTLNINFNSDDDFIIAVDDYFACIKMLQENGIVININHIRYNKKCNKITYKGEEILFDTIYIRPKIQHILDDISINKIISNE